MDEFPPNARSAPRDPKKEVKKVVTGSVVTKTPPLNKRLLHTFFKGHAKNTWSEVLADVAVPAIKDLIADMVTQTIERQLFGDARSRLRRPSYSAGNYNGPTVSYNRYSGGGSRNAPGKANRPERPSNHNFNDISVETRAEGDAVLEGMYLLLEQYSQVTVSDLYDLVDITGDYTDEKWGWTDLRGSDISRDRGGRYLLVLPRPIPLD